MSYVGGEVELCKYCLYPLETREERLEGYHIICKEQFLENLETSRIYSEKI